MRADARDEPLLGRRAAAARREAVVGCAGLTWAADGPWRSALLAVLGAAPAAGPTGLKTAPGRKRRKEGGGKMNFCCF